MRDITEMPPFLSLSGLFSGPEDGGAFSGITDLHVCDGSPGKSMVFPGPRLAPAELQQDIATLLSRCRASSKSDFMITLNGEFFRVRQETRAVDGTWYRLRRMPADPPSLDTLPTALPPGIKRLLLSPRLRAGGLVYIVGAPGQGKTTTASATLVTRLRNFGGFALTVEDPPEMPLNGWHKDGYCSQTWVAGDAEADWAESFRGVLRSQPAGTPSILFVGEVRDAASAHAIMRAAAHGFLVIATGFGMDIVSGLESLINLSGDKGGSAASLSGLLRLAVHQRLVNDQLIATALASRDGTTAIAAKIRSGSVGHLLSDIEFQATQSMRGVDLFDSQGV